MSPRMAVARAINYSAIPREFGYGRGIAESWKNIDRVEREVIKGYADGVIADLNKLGFDVVPKKRVK